LPPGEEFNRFERKINRYCANHLALTDADISKRWRRTAGGRPIKINIFSWVVKIFHKIKENSVSANRLLWQETRLNIKMDNFYPILSALLSSLGI
jgi:hypothetical protein